VAEGPTKVKPSRPRQRGDDERPILEVLDGARRGDLIELQGPQVIVGRTEEVHVRLTDDGVSREHAKFLLTEDGIVNLIDLGSTNGTFVNGARIDVTIVREGDRIQFGPDVTMRFVFRSRDAPKPKARESSIPSEPAHELSARELEVAQLVAEGLTNAEIGKRLHISPYTVMTHLSNVYARIGIKSRASLAKLVTAGRLYSR
jgi:pSer/pThr/pTyr-binding forkhead associated (FHA) protein